MAPNLLVATQTLFTPHRWFSRKTASPEKATRRSEHWDDPMPGTYEYIPARGWYLTRPDNHDGVPGERLDKPKPVKYSRVLRRYLFDAEYQRRKLPGQLTDAHGKVREAGFFQLDDGVAWVNCWNHKGEFVPGPYERWCIDDRTEKFRKMLKGDDPEWRSRQTSRAGKPSGRKVSADGGKEKNGVYHIPAEGHSRPASTLDMVLTPPASCPASPKCDASRSEGGTRVNSRANSLSGSTVVHSTTGPSSLRGYNHEETTAKPTNGTRGLAAAVTKRLEVQERLIEHKAN